MAGFLRGRKAEAGNNARVGDLCRVFAGTSNSPLASSICEELGIQLGSVDVKRFSDGETFVRINENIRGRDVFIVQSTSMPDTNIIELLMLIDAAKRASADRVTAVIPYFGYARQDRKDQPRVALTAKLMANLVSAAGADRVLTMDLHADQIQGFFDVPVDHLFAAPILVDHFQGLDLDDIIIVSPDTGGVKTARWFAKRIGDNIDLAIIDKRRPAPNENEVMNVVGDVTDRTCIIIDDMIDTGGTTVRAAEALMDAGAKGVYAGCTHSVFSGEAKTRLQASKLIQTVATDTILHAPDTLGERIEILSVAGLLAEAIRRIHRSESISILFN